MLGVWGYAMPIAVAQQSYYNKSTLFLLISFIKEPANRSGCKDTIGAHSQTLNPQPEILHPNWTEDEEC